MPRIKPKGGDRAEAKSALKPTPRGMPPSAPLPLHSQGRRTARVFFAVALVALALWIARDFLAPLAWAAILAIAVWQMSPQHSARR